jgi:hypothetical protein
MGYSTSANLKAWLAAFIMLVGTAACASSPPPRSIAYLSKGDTAALKVEALSRYEKDTANFYVFGETLSATYDRVFSSTVQVLKAQGDSIEQADGDKGYIVTKQGTHGNFMAPSWVRYYIVFESVSSSRTRIGFKLCSYHWEDTIHQTNEYYHEADSQDFNYMKAARFLEGVRRAL